MAVLGKDLFDLKRSRTNTKIEFGSEGYWVESNREQQPYGSVLTEILNLDAEPYQQLLNNLEHVIMAEDYATAPRAFMDAVGGFGALPLYRSYMEDLRLFGKMQVEDFVVGEAREAFAESVIQNDNRLCSFMQQTIDEIRFIQRRYGWFLDRMSKGKEFEKKKGQRKIAPAEQIVEWMLDAFVSGVSLGEDTTVDAPTVRSQYMVRVEEGATPELVEKMFIDGALDFRSDAVLTNARQYAAALKALRLLETATASLKKGFPVDVCCSDAEGAMEALAELDGRAVSEDLVSEIFSHFCVGK